MGISLLSEKIKLADSLLSVSVAKMVFFEKFGLFLVFFFAPKVLFFEILTLKKKEQQKKKKKIILVLQAVK